MKVFHKFAVPVVLSLALLGLSACDAPADSASAPALAPIMAAPVTVSGDELAQLIGASIDPDASVTYEGFSISGDTLALASLTATTGRGEEIEARGVKAKIAAVAELQFEIAEISIEQIAYASIEQKIGAYETLTIDQLSLIRPSEKFLGFVLDVLSGAPATDEETLAAVGFQYLEIATATLGEGVGATVIKELAIDQMGPELIEALTVAEISDTPLANGLPTTSFQGIRIENLKREAVNRAIRKMSGVDASDENEGIISTIGPLDFGADRISIVKFQLISDSGNLQAFNLEGLSLTTNRNGQGVATSANLAPLQFSFAMPGDGSNDPLNPGRLIGTVIGNPISGTIAFDFNYNEKDETVKAVGGLMIDDAISLGVDGLFKNFEEVTANFNPFSAYEADESAGGLTVRDFTLKVVDEGMIARLMDETGEGRSERAMSQMFFRLMVASWIAGAGGDDLSGDVDRFLDELGEITFTFHADDYVKFDKLMDGEEAGVTFSSDVKAKK